ALEQLHGDEWLAGVLLDVEDGADVGVIEPRSGPRFTLESPEGDRVTGELVWQKLERHRASEPEILGPVHHPHPTTTEHRDRTVMGRLLADQVHEARGVPDGRE